MRDENMCPLCNGQAELVGKALDVIVTCRRCGVFQVPVIMTEQNYFKVNPGFEKYQNLLSIVTRKVYERSIRNGGRDGIVVLDSKRFEELTAGIEDGGVVFAAEGFLLYLSELQKSFSDWQEFDPTLDYPLASCKNAEDFVVVTYYLRESGLLTLEWHPTARKLDAGDKISMRLSPKGFERIREIQKTRSKTEVFIAMWFDPSMNNAYTQAMEKAIKDTTTLHPIRADKEEHNQDINDWIIGHIRQSAFMIADFTGHRGGVYFEAGYALGLGIPVIFTCKESDKDGRHFDTEHRNHIFWKDEEKLYNKLVDRIRATIPLEYLK